MAQAGDAVSGRLAGLAFRLDKAADSQPGECRTGVFEHWELQIASSVELFAAEVIETLKEHALGRGQSEIGQCRDLLCGLSCLKDGFLFRIVKTAFSGARKRAAATSKARDL